MVPGIKIHTSGDVIEVKLMDNSHNVFFKQKASLNKPKQIKDLLETLRQKGVPI